MKKIIGLFALLLLGCTDTETWVSLSVVDQSGTPISKNIKVTFLDKSDVIVGYVNRAPKTFNYWAHDDSNWGKYVKTVHLEAIHCEAKKIPVHFQKKHAGSWGCLFPGIVHPNNQRCPFTYYDYDFDAKIKLQCNTLPRDSTLVNLILKLHSYPNLKYVVALSKFSREELSKAISAESSEQYFFDILARTVNFENHKEFNLREVVLRHHSKMGFWLRFSER